MACWAFLAGTEEYDWRGMRLMSLLDSADGVLSQSRHSPANNAFCGNDSGFFSIIHSPSTLAGCTFNALMGELGRLLSIALAIFRCFALSSAECFAADVPSGASLAQRGGAVDAIPEGKYVSCGAIARIRRTGLTHLRCRHPALGPDGAPPQLQAAAREQHAAARLALAIGDLEELQPEPAIEESKTRRRRASSPSRKGARKGSRRTALQQVDGNTGAASPLERQAVRTRTPPASPARRHASIDVFSEKEVSMFQAIADKAEASRREMRSSAMKQRGNRRSKRRKRSVEDINFAM